MSGPAILERELLPARLKDLAEPPERLYVRGELPRAAAVAIVGTRRPTREGTHFARHLASELASQGVAILSGGAEGIDTAAHSGALDVLGKTMVVAPAGFEQPFPEQNRELFESVVRAGGAYASLVEDHVAACRASFFPRNACLVALAHAVVVVEAPFRSGARNAAAWARRLGRPLFAVPHSPWSSEGRGCVAELKLGARPLDTPKDVLKVLHAAGAHGFAPSAQDSAQPANQLSEGAAGPCDPVISALQNGAAHVDDIAQQTGLSVSAVQQRILTLSLAGVLVRDPSGRPRLLTS